MISSLSSIAASCTPSSISRSLSFSVEITKLSAEAISSLFEIRGNISLTACSASNHAARSSRESARRWSRFVPVKIENRLSSEPLSLIDETWSIKNRRSWIQNYPFIKISNSN